MKKLLFLTASSILLFSCSGKEYVSREDFSLLKEKVKRNEFMIKQTAAQVEYLRNALKELDYKVNIYKRKELLLQERIKELYKKIDKPKKVEKKKYKKIGVVLGRVVNLRKKPTTKSKILAKLPKGVIVEVKGKDGNWYRVKLHNLEGFIYKPLISVVKTCE